jgi:phosphoglycerate dehydrogenase-like enzyme
MDGDHHVLVDHNVPVEDDAELTAFEDRLRSSLPEVTVRVASDYDDALEKIRTATVVVSEYLPGEKLTAAEELQWLQATSAGVDHYDLDEFRERDVAVTTASGIHAEPIAEQVIGYMLHFERGFHRAVRQQADGRWEEFRGGELTGKTVGIVGTGAIGQRVAALSDAFGMTAIGIRNDPTTIPDPIDEIFGPDELHTVLGRSDYVVLACPLTEETHHLLSIKELSSMKPTAVLINIARGAVVNEDHLVRALQSRDIRGAALDVTETEPLPADSPLWDLSNTLVTPHMAGLTPRYLDRLGDLFVENYRLFLEDGSGDLKNRVC